MTEEDAMERHSIKKAVMRLWRNQACPANILAVCGGKSHLPMPYCRFNYVFLAPEGMSASLYPITLRDWSRMCEYFSNTVNTVIRTDDKVDKSFRVLFEKYTNGTEATPSNIAKAFEEGVMKHSSKLPVPVPKRVGRPKKTTTDDDNNNSNKKSAAAENQKQKMREETVNDLLPSEERLTNVLVNRYKQLEEKEVARDEEVSKIGALEKEVARDKELSKIGALMKLAEIDCLKFKHTTSRKSAAKVECNMIFTVCKCGRNRVIGARKNQSDLCRKCCTRQSAAKKIEKRRRENSLKRVAADSCVPITLLSHEEICIRMQNMNNERGKREQERKRLVDEVAKLTEERDFFIKKARGESEEFKL